MTTTPEGLPKLPEADAPLVPTGITLKDGKFAIGYVADIEQARLIATFEPEVDRWRSETDPHCRVEYFFEDNAGLFQDSAEAWQQIKSDQKRIAEIPIATQLSTGSRGARRHKDKQAGGFNRNVILGSVKSRGQEIMTHLNNVLPPNMPYAAKKVLVDPYIDNMVMPGIREVLKNMGSSSLSPQLEIERNKGAGWYMKAFLARDEVLSRTHELLADEQAAPIFLERIQQMAEEVAVDEYPGFLEVIATDVLQRGENNNMLRPIVEQSMPDAQVYTGEFFEGQLRGTIPHKGKETSAFIHAVKLAGLVLEPEGITDIVLAQRMAAHPKEWPTEMQVGLQGYVRGLSQERWSVYRAALKPYMREGRLPVVKGSQASGRMGSSSGRVKVSLGSRTQDHESVVASDKISSFAIIGRAAAKGVFELEPVDDLDQLYTKSNLAEYARKHPEDKSLEPLFRAALEHLAQPPYDSTRVRKLGEVAYRLDGDATDRKRKPYRLRLQGTPDIAKGPIAEATRLIFDIIRQDGKPTLAIYGAFIKQLIHDMNELPSRR